MTPQEVERALQYVLDEGCPPEESGKKSTCFEWEYGHGNPRACIDCWMDSLRGGAETKKKEEAEK